MPTFTQIRRSFRRQPFRTMLGLILLLIWFIIDTALTITCFVLIRILELMNWAISRVS